MPKRRDLVTELERGRKRGRERDRGKKGEGEEQKGTKYWVKVEGISEGKEDIMESI